MNILFSYFIKIISKVIIEKSLCEILTARLYFIFISIVYNGLSTLHPNINSIDNFKSNIKKSWLNFFTDEQFYNNLIIYISINSLILLNKNLNSSILNDYILNILPDLLNYNYEYKYFIKNNSEYLNNLLNELVNYYNDNWTNNNIELEKWGLTKGLISDNHFINIEKYLIDKFNNIDINNESKEILNISLNLNEEHKIISEFWKAGKDTVTICGFWNLFLCGYLKTNKISSHLQVDFFYKLNCAIFQSTIIIWNIKYKCLMPRPTQNINNNYSDLFDKQIWHSCQDNTMPNYPDFISCHSTISSAASFILDNILGSNIYKLGIKLSNDELKMLSPLFIDYPFE